MSTSASTSLLSLLLLLLFTCVLSQTPKTPIFAYSHFRHGARGPLNLLSNGSDYFGEQWDTAGELTAVGMRTEFLLGYRNHLRYQSLLSATYDPRELYVVSSDINRTIMSATAQLQGLYPESTGPTLTDEQLNHTIVPTTITEDIQAEIDRLQNVSLPNQINTIPIHVYYNGERRFRLHDANICTPLKEIKTNNGNTNKDALKLVEDFSTKYQSALEQFIIGEGQNYSDIVYLNKLTDQYISDVYNGRNMSWISAYGVDPDTFLNDSLNVFQGVIQYYLYGDAERQVYRMAMSPIFGEMLTYMKNRVNAVILNQHDVKYNDYTKPKFVMVSGHDTSIGGSQLFMKELFELQHEFITPVFNSHSSFEVFLNETSSEGADVLSYNDFYVEYSFNDQLLGTFNFARFVEVVEQALMTQEEIGKFCDFEEYKNKEGSVYVWTTVLFGVLLLVLIIVVVVCFLKYSKLPKEVEDYKKVEEGVFPRVTV